MRSSSDIDADALLVFRFVAFAALLPTFSADATPPAAIDTPPAGDTPLSRRRLRRRHCRYYEFAESAARFSEFSAIAISLDACFAC
jgi:hypothetical protein